MEFGKRPTVFEQILDVKACSNTLQEARKLAADRPNDFMASLAVQQAERALAKAARMSRNRLTLIKGDTE